MKPANQVSKLSLVVPVLPAAGLPSFCAGPPVPSRTTPRSMSVRTKAFSALITRSPVSNWPAYAPPSRSISGAQASSKAV